jgi:hypothetical protein
VLLLGCRNSFWKLREKMAIANKKYRRTDKGREKMSMLHKAWILTKKDDEEYKLKVKESYIARKFRKKQLDDFSKTLVTI